LISDQPAEARAQNELTQQYRNLFSVFHKHRAAIKLLIFRTIGAPVSDPARSCGRTPTRRVGGRRSGRFMESSLFLSDLLTGHEPALGPERELSQLAALRQATRLGRFSARANIRAAVWDKPRSDCIVGISRFMGRPSHGWRYGSGLF